MQVQINARETAFLMLLRGQSHWCQTDSCAYFNNSSKLHCFSPYACETNREYFQGPCKPAQNNKSKSSLVLQRLLLTPLYYRLLIFLIANREDRMRSTELNLDCEAVAGLLDVLEAMLASRPTEARAICEWPQCISRPGYESWKRYGQQAVARPSWKSARGGRQAPGGDSGGGTWRNSRRLSE